MEQEGVRFLEVQELMNKRQNTSAQKHHLEKEAFGPEVSSEKAYSFFPYRIAVCVRESTYFLREQTDT